MSVNDDVPVLKDVVKPGNTENTGSNRRSSTASPVSKAKEARIACIIDKHLIALRKELRRELLSEKP